MRVCFSGHIADGGVSRHCCRIAHIICADSHAMGLRLGKEVSAQVLPFYRS